jgi:hypothetical protein
MANILERLSAGITAFRNPQTLDASGEAKYLQEVYYNRSGNERPNWWYRLATETGNTCGLYYHCACGFAAKFLNAFEALRDYKCTSCGRAFTSLTKQLEIDLSKTPVNQWASIVDARLQARPNITNKDASGAVKTGDWGDGADDVWQGKTPAGSDGRWV